MRPIPVGASAAMVFSLVVAFVVTPWAAVRLLRVSARAWRGTRGPAHRALPARDGARSSHAPARGGFPSGVGAAPRRRRALVPLGCVTVKMLPFDNKSELQVVVRMPDGTPLERPAPPPARWPTRRCATPPVLSVQSYAGAASPFTFNGLVRHYFLRRQPNLADLQVMLVDKDERARAEPRDRQSGCAPGWIRLPSRLGARIQVVEVPPGPPVLQTLVAEVYGPDPARRLELARTVRDTFERTAGVVDVDWYVDSPR